MPNLYKEVDGKIEDASITYNLNDKCGIDFENMSYAVKDLVVMLYDKIKQLEDRIKELETNN